MLTSSSCFSQIGISEIKSSDTTKVVLTPEVAKQVVKDLIRYDGCKVELKLTQDKVNFLSNITFYSYQSVPYLILVHIKYELL